MRDNEIQVHFSFAFLFTSLFRGIYIQDVVYDSILNQNTFSNKKTDINIKTHSSRLVKLVKISDAIYKI